MICGAGSDEPVRIDTCEPAVFPMMPAPNTSASPWPHRWAVLLAATTFPLIWVGGLVTTYEAGMAVPDWPTTYGYNLFLYPWQTWLFGPFDLFIEHGHRLLGAAVGMLTIGLMVAVWRNDGRPWMRWLTLIALAAVIFQGLLGGMRVLLDERLLAKIHGCFGPAFFALCASLAVVTSRWWQTTTAAVVERPERRFRSLALLTVLLTYGQIVLGAQLRHVSLTLSAGGFRILVLFHLLVALVLLAVVSLLFIRALRLAPRPVQVVRPAVGLAVLVGVQWLLGLGTWIVNFGWPAWTGGYAMSEAFVIPHASWQQALVTTAHVAFGSAILATSVVLAVRTVRLYRPIAAAASTAPDSQRPPEAENSNSRRGSMWRQVQVRLPQEGLTA